MSFAIICVRGRGFIDWLDRCAIAQRCPPSAEKPTETPNETEGDDIQKDVCENADGDDLVRTDLMLVSIGHHEPDAARPKEYASTCGDEVTEGRNCEEQQRYRSADSDSDHNGPSKFWETHDTI
jgi:hypothetical protein